MTLSSDQLIRTVIFGPPVEADQMRRLLNSVGNSPSNASNEKQDERFRILAVNQDLADRNAFEQTIGNKAQLVLVHQSVAGFSTKVIHELVHTPGPSARVVAVFVTPLGDVFDAVMNSGAVTYRLPVRKPSFENLVAQMDALLAEATEHMATGQARPAAPPEPEEIPPPSLLSGMARLALQAISVWSSKGGDGKSMLAMELAYILANLGGRQVLLVDADMSRGFMASVMSEPARRHATTHNITAMATMFVANGKFPSLKEYVFTYPPSFGGGSNSNLDILFGISSPEQASLEAFTQNGGDAAFRFVNGLVSQAQSLGYEFVIFDIGTLVPVPVHMAALKVSSKVLVVAIPATGSVEPTHRGLQQMEKHDLLGKKKLALVINKWTKDSGITIDDIPDYLKITRYATIPAIELGLMHRVPNQARFYTEAYLGNPKQYAQLAPLVSQLIALGDAFAPGLRGHALAEFSQVREAFDGHRRGLFSRIRS